MKTPRTKQLISLISLIGFMGLVALFARAAQVPQEQCRSESGGYCVNIAALAGAAQGTEAIPGLEFLRINRGAPIQDVIEQIYVFGITLVGLAAFIMFVYGGFEYMFAGDKDPTAAKERMKNAIKGLLLALGSWLILYTINPALVQKSDLGLRPLQFIRSVDTFEFPTELSISEFQQNLIKNLIKQEGNESIDLFTERCAKSLRGIVGEIFGSRREFANVCLSKLVLTTQRIQEANFQTDTKICKDAGGETRTILLKPTGKMILCTTSIRKPPNP